MNMIVLSNEKTAYQVEKGRAILYARLIKDEHARLHALKALESGDIIGPLKSFSGYEAVLSGGVVKPCEKRETVYTQDDFNAAIQGIAGGLAKEQALVLERQTRHDQYVQSTFTQYKGAVSRAGELDETTIDNEDYLVGAVKAIAKYLGTQVVVPTLDVLETTAAYLETMLRLSRIQSRPVTLKDNWHRRHSGAMLGYLKDGSPVALLPMGLNGYRLYDPKTCTSRRITAEVAQSLSPGAISLLRTFPDEPIGFKQMLQFILGENIYFEIAIILLFSFLASLVAILPPIISKQIFDEIVPGHHIGLLAEVSAVLLTFQIAAIGFTILINLAFSRIKMKVDMSLQSAVWHRLLKQNITFFYRNTTGEMLSRIRGLSALNQTITLPLLQSIPAMLFSFVNIAVLYRYCAAITPTVLWMFAGLFLITYLFDRAIYRTSLALSALQDKAMSLNLQFVSTMDRIQASFAQNAVYGVMAKNGANIRKLQTRVKFLQDALEAFYAFFGFASVAVVYLLIANTQGLALGDFVAYIAAFLTFESVMLSFMRTLNILPGLMASLKKVSPILKSVPDAKGDKAIPKNLDGSFELRHGHFAYDVSARPVLTDLNFRVEKGESLGVVGVSGCGKSTLLKLLLGLYKPSSGQVLLGGYDLATVDLPLLRKQIGVAMQGTDLPTGSLYSALTEDDPALTEEAIWNALEKVDMAEDVRRLADGLNTQLENENSHLSQGQRQRLAVARAIIKPRPYLFLDETTSHLDNIGQAVLMRAVNDLPCTKLIIAQRLATVEKCDKLLIMEDGCIHAFGTYKELINQQHLYSEVFDDNDDDDGE